MPRILGEVAEHFDKDAQGNVIPRAPDKHAPALQQAWQTAEESIPILRKNVPERRIPLTMPTMRAD
jgi:hypothetical protein